ncbi:YjcZ family sporulation protein [Salipaludibacillus sp. CUR1]|nr:YjcZ family sporulation protein [Salipaludibacillus sp. CUR1]MCE7790939.1 YjcZ family sporulation protein [Salipaludibacillus sp. CUR1]
MSYYKPYNDFALIVVLFILLVIVGTAYIKW